MNKELLASTSVFAEMANNSVDLQKIINEFIVNIYILNNTYTQSSNEIKSELVKHFDIDVPEAVIRSQLNRLKRENVIEQVKDQFIITPDHRASRQYINDEVKDKKQSQKRIFKELSDYVRYLKGPLTDEDNRKLEGVFIEYLFDSSITDEYAALISGFIVKNENNLNFTKELNLIREGATILKGIHYTTDFNDANIWRNHLTIYLDTEHLLSLSGLNGETFKLMLMDFYDLVRDINTKVTKKSGKLIHLKFTKNVKSEIENLFHVAELIVQNKLTLQPGKTAIKNIVNGCANRSDITRKTAEFFISLTSMGIYEADEIDLLENPKYNVIDESALVKYSDDKTEDEIHEILKDFTFINNLRKGNNKRGFENIGHIIMTGDRITRLMSFDNDLKMADSSFSFATDVFYVTQRLWFKLNKGLGFTSKLPSTLNIVNKARIIISSQINSSVRARYNALEKEVKIGARTPDEVKEYYLRLRSNTFSPENINADSIEEQISFIYNMDDVDNYLKNRSHEKSVHAERKKKVDKLRQENKLKDAKNEKIRLELLNTSKNNARDTYKSYKMFAMLAIALVVIIIGLIIYILRQETDTPLSIVSMIFSISPLIISLISWKKIKQMLYKKAYEKHEDLVATEN